MPVVSAAQEQKLAVITWRGDTAAEEGLYQVLAGWTGPLAVDKYDAAQNPIRLTRIIDSLLKAPPDVIYTYGTTVTKEVLRHFNTVPVVFNIVNRPVLSGIIQSWERPGGNATGASNQISVINQLSTLKKVKNFKRLGVIYNPLEQNSKIQRDIVKTLEEPFNFSLIDFKVPCCSADVQKIIRGLENTVDAVFIPADTMMVVHGTDLGARLIEYRIPAIGSLSSMVTEHSILLGLVPDYNQLGRLAGSKIIQILEGSDPAEIPASRLEFFDLYVNIKTARAMGIQIPMSLLVMSNTIVR